MKTIKDLVEHLNAKFSYGDFYIEKDDEMDSYTLYMKALGHNYRLIKMSKKYKKWIAQPSFGLASADVQITIMDFVYTTDNKHWFDKPSEKKYNIVIGEDTGTRQKSVYEKSSTGTLVCYAVDEQLLTKDPFMFTESEVEKLKSDLPENMAEIVELGKVEIKDED